MNHILRKIFTILAAFFITSSSVFAAQPNTGEERAYTFSPIVVTAEKREEDLQKVPVSVTVLTEDQIRDARINSIQDISLRVPNLFTTSWGNRGISWVFVRGIGAINNDPAISFNVDGVNYMDSRIFNSGLYDIERIEVLRGPQGTLYGRNSLGGVINIITRKPDNNPHFGFEQTFGRYEQFGSKIYARTPLIEDKLYFGISGEFDSRDGYARNDFLNRDTDYRENYNGRAQLRWTPTDKIDIQATFDAEKVHDGAYPLQPRDTAKDQPRRGDYDYRGFDRRDGVGGSLRASFDLPWLNITSISAFRGYNNTTRNDQDFMTFDLMQARDHVKDRQFSEELRFSSLEGRAPFKWLAGIYAYRHDRDETLDYDYGQDAVTMGMVPFTFTNRAGSDLNSKGIAIFGQGTYTFFDKLDLTLGLRYEYEKNTMHYNSKNLGSYMGFPISSIPGMEDSYLDGSRSDSEFLPKVQINYRWTDNFMTYAGVARGFRSGGFNTGVNSLSQSDFSFNPEYSWNYEIGFKSSLFDNRITLNGAAFYIDLRDQQVTQVLPDTNTIIDNAGRSRSMGFELETSALLGAGFRLDASYGYTNVEYRKYADEVTGQDYKGNRPPLTPEHTYSVALQHTLPVMDSFQWFGKNDSLDWVNRIELQGVGDFYWNDANTLKQSGYGIFNLSSSVKTDNLTFTFWVHNLFDKQYNVVCFEHPLHPSSLVEVGAPRTFGVTLRADF